jgi:hypothetical protein
VDGRPIKAAALSLVTPLAAAAPSTAPSPDGRVAAITSGHRPIHNIQELLERAVDFFRFDRGSSREERKPRRQSPLVPDDLAPLPPA